MFTKTLKKIPFMARFLSKLDNFHERDQWVANELALLPKNSSILDAGCGSQQFRKYCSHLKYYGQDFGQYVSDEKKMLGAREGGLGGVAGYHYGPLDFEGDIWSINVENGSFDHILCTEVFEHIPYPIETVAEFARIIKRGGTLLLTAPSNCLRHMDPYFFYSGFSDRWYERILSEHGFKIVEITPIGDYNSWMRVELARTMYSNGIISKILLLPAFLYFSYKKKTMESIDTLCMGYHVKAEKK